MDWIASAELLSALDRSSVALDPKRCLHTIWKFSSCDACFDVCPVAAIQPGKPPVLDSQKCASCLACLPACPTGAFMTDDAAPSLSNCLARLDAQRVELFCAQYPQPEIGLPDMDAAVKLRGCLAGLGAGGYLAPLALGLEQVCVRLDGCQTCAWGSLRPRIEAQIAAAQRLLEPWGKAGALQIYAGAGAHAPAAGAAAAVVSASGVPAAGVPAAIDHPRPVWDADNPPLSRRDFFRMASRQSRMTTARILNQRADTVAPRQPGKDHRRITATLRHLPQPAPWSGFSLAGLGYGVLQISAECSACGVCANICPTAALKFQREDEARFSLVFNPADCIACGICVQVCTPAAIALDDAPHSSQIFDVDTLVLLEGPLARCESCSVLMAAQPGKKFCALCEFRRKNPLGGVMPPGFKKPIG
jgi:ferredoxin